MVFREQLLFFEYDVETFLGFYFFDWWVHEFALGLSKEFVGIFFDWD